MNKLLRADFYRLFRSKSFYICTLIACGIIMLNMWAYHTMSNLDAQTIGQSVNPFQDAISYGIYVFTSGQANLFMAIFIAIFVTSEFTFGTMKNIVSKGYNRIQIYLSKLITMIVASILMVVVLSIVGLIVAWIATGTFGTISGGLLLDLLRVMGISILLHTALASIFVMVGMVVRNNGGVIAINIGLITLGTLIFYFLNVLFKNKFDFMKYSVQNNMALLNTATEGSDILRMVIVAGVYMAVTVLLGLLAFKQSDIK